MVTAINNHRDKQSSEIVTQKRLKGLNNNITQTKYYGTDCLDNVIYFVLFRNTQFKFERFENGLSL